ncbi:uncharacterized protein BX664DRAFT_340408 [Halteromyces radiatus]|uniref:uncharacterized protein n=1 Tax=Halteromyces radiatus TaxID=101107 RepID=UPI002221283C|nr:uncharacterized protein BX664DRAFT_340408 [Halteromyces radiatus]KAI8081446.1 hypothetical protein BX664DRAFT_340408 [Halteromyces radiatus]
MVQKYCNDYQQYGTKYTTTVLLTLITKTADDPGFFSETTIEFNNDLLTLTTIEDMQYSPYHYSRKHKTDGTTEHEWKVDKSILSQHSPYFAAMFEHDFYESSIPIICLPSTILSSMGLSSVIHYMYYSRDSTSMSGWLDSTQQQYQQQQQPNQSLLLFDHEIDEQEKLYLLQETYLAADYFGMTDLCIKVADLFGELVHQWTCYCDDCACLTPQLFEFINGNIQQFNDFTTINNTILHILTKNNRSKSKNTTLQEDDLLYQLYIKVILSLTHDPEKCLPTFWTHRMMARMLDHLPSDHSLMLSQLVSKRVSKCNAVESLHSCFLATNLLSTMDPLLCWSRSLHATLALVQAKSTQLIARHFEYYCSQYPALLSCIDGITYSFDFLEYLFMHVLEDQMDIMNAGLLYQGLVRDLMCRHAVSYHTQVKHILSVAKDIILSYMSPRLDQFIKMAALDILDTNTLKALAIELDVPARSLVKSLEKHQGLVQQSLLTIIFPPPKISYPSSSAASINMSRRSSTTTQRTYSLQSNVTSIYSNNRRDDSSKSLTRWIKGWLESMEPDSHRRRHVHPISQENNKASSSSTTKSTLFSWATVPLRSPKKKRGWLRRILHSDLTKQAQRKSSMIVVGKRVQLTRRPVLTVGTVKYVGPVSFADGIWIGVELDRRVGKNDGSYENIRYFDSTPNRGVFVRSDDLKVMF